VPKLIQSLVWAAGANANLLLNIGPTESGKVIPEFSQRLQAVGAWLSQNGETIYGTREGPIAPRGWGVSTQKAGVVYLHILDWPDEYLALPFVQGVKGAHLYHGNAPLKLAALDGGLVLKLPKENRDPMDTIVVLEH
jgi:alpha-L-fucosidase